MTQKHQRGSILGFVVVGVLLTIAVVGGIYLVKNQLNGNMPNLSDSDEVAVVDDETGDSTANNDNTSSDKGQTDQTTDNDTATDQSPVEEEPSTTEPDSGSVTHDTGDDIPPTGVAADEPVSDDSNQTETTTEASGLPQTGVEVEELPQTGLTDGLYALVALGALTGSIVAFRRSNLL